MGDNDGICAFFSPQVQCCWPSLQSSGALGNQKQGVLPIGAFADMVTEPEAFLACNW
jgi:hypothetical protein